MPYGMKAPATFETQVQLHVFVVLSWQVGLKKLYIMWNAVNDTYAETAL